MDSRKLKTLGRIAVGWLLCLDSSQLMPTCAVCVLAIPQLCLLPASLTARIPFSKPQFVQRVGGYSELYFLLGVILHLWAVAKSAPRPSGVPCETHMNTLLRQAAPGVSPTRGQHTPPLPAFAQLLVTESVGVKRHESKDLHRVLGGWASEMTLPLTDHPLPRRQPELG